MARDFGAAATAAKMVRETSGAFATVSNLKAYAAMQIFPELGSLIVLDPIIGSMEGFDSEVAVIRSLKF